MVGRQFAMHNRKIGRARSRFTRISEDSSFPRALRNAEAGIKGQAKETALIKFLDQFHQPTGDIEERFGNKFIVLHDPHMSLLIDNETSKETAALVHALAILTNNLGLAIVAEGVERESEVVILRELGCHYGQGYFFARPQSPDAFAEFALRQVAEGCSVVSASAFAGRWAELTAR